MRSASAWTRTRMALAVGSVGFAAVSCIGGAASFEEARVAAASGSGGRSATAAASAPGVAVPTFYSDVLPILQDNCQVCHREAGRGAGGLVAPMALETYEQARAWAPIIAVEVRAGRMPPWGAHVQHKGTFIGERYLEDDDKAALLAWAENGAPEGDPGAAPRAPTEAGIAPGEWWLGEPDLVVGFAEPVRVADDIHDWQPTIHVPVTREQHPEARWIRSSELKAGGSYVHHIVSSHLGVGTPGRGAFTYPPGFSVLLPPDPTITFGMHYYKDPGPGTEIYDSTEGAFEFYRPGEVVDHIIQTDLNWNREFAIPPGHSNYEVRREMPFAEDTYLLSMGPHMHFRGKAVRMELELPDGRRETLLWVPQYDFNWQFLYQFREPLLMPAGSVLHTTWWFDNSAANPNNPDPTAEVRYGEETFNEMANARIYFASAKPLGIVVGEPIPEEILAAARDAEDRRRAALERSGALQGHQPE